MEKEIEEKEQWYKGPIRFIIGIFLLLIIIMMVIPYYSVKLDPEPRGGVELGEINEFITADASKTVQGIDMAGEIYDRGDAQIKFAADKIVTSSCSESDVCYVKALYYFVRDKIKYVGDPVAREYIEAPEIVLKSGAADCESGSLLLLSLMESIGVNGELVLIPGHAFIRVKLDKASGRYKHKGWIYLDWTCGNCKFGEVPYGNIDRDYEGMRFLDIQ